MSYFNFKLFNRPIKNVNTDLAFKQGNWAPGYPIKGGRAPILGYRKNLECRRSCGNISGWPISFDLYISNNLYASGPGIGRWTIVPELWVRPSIAALPDTPYNPVYKGPNDSTGNPTYMTFGYGAATSPADPKQWNIFNSKDGKTGLEWLIQFDVSQTFGDPPTPPATAYRFTNMPNSLSANFTTVESLNLPSYPNKISEKDELNLIQKIFTVTNNNSGGTVTISNLLNRTPTPNEKIYKDNWAKSCATNGEVCYNPVIKRIQNNNRKRTKPYNYTTRNLLRSRFSTYEQNAYNFDLRDNLTAWSGGADPENNSYLIHDCSCNAAFTANNPCIATYKPLNPQFAVNTAVSGRSRIARLKYNAKKRVAVTKKIPFGLLGYPKNSCEFCKRDFKPSKGRKGGDDKRRINSRLAPNPVQLN